MSQRKRHFKSSRLKYHTQTGGVIKFQFRAEHVYVELLRPLFSPILPQVEFLIKTRSICCITECLRAGKLLRSPHKNASRLTHAHTPARQEFIKKTVRNSSNQQKNLAVMQSGQVQGGEGTTAAGTWVRVCSRCSAACSFCHICLSFLGKRSEKETGRWIRGALNSFCMLQHVYKSDSEYLV